MAVPGAVSDLSALHISDIAVDSGGDAVQAHLSRPVAAGVRPGIVVIHEARGLNPHIRDVSNRLASLDFDVIAPELYSREGPPSGDMASIMRAMFTLPDARVVADLEACAAYLRSLDSASGRVGCVGFCMGGRYTLLFACASRAVDAVVDCWGGFVDRATPDAETTEFRPVPVINLLGGVECPVYLAGGAEDGNPSPAMLEELRSRLAAAGREVAMDVFANAGHAFLADDRPNYREEAAFALWPRIVSFFETHLR